MTNLAPIRDYWNSAAPTFDDEVDHGLRDPSAHQAWAALFRTWIPTPSRVLDLGCGTGSLSVLLAGQGHRVTGVDLSPRMIELARAKAAGSTVDFSVGDASAPEVTGPFDVVVVRHLLWTLADPVAALRNWRDLLAPDGRFVLVEGRWAQSGGEPYGRVRNPCRGRAACPPRRSPPSYARWRVPWKSTRSPIRCCGANR